MKCIYILKNSLLYKNIFFYYKLFVLLHCNGYDWKELFYSYSSMGLVSNYRKLIYFGNDIHIPGGGICEKLKEVYKDNLIINKDIEGISLTQDIGFIIYNDLTKNQSIGLQIENLYPSQYQSGGKYLIDIKTYHKIRLIPISAIVKNLVTDWEVKRLDSVINKKKLKIFYFEECRVNQLSNLSPYEEKILKLGEDMGNLLSGDYDVKDQYSVFSNWDEELKLLYGEKYSVEYISSIRNMRKTKVIKKGGLPYRIGYSEFVNYEDGHRRVVGTPSQYKRQILCLGRSTILGGRVEDADTVPSQLQRVCNELMGDIRVTEYSMGGATLRLLFKRIRQQSLGVNDIVILYWPSNSKLKNYFSQRRSYYKLKELVFDNRDEWKQGGEVFFDITHYNALASKVIAEKTAEIVLNEIKLDEDIAVVKKDKLFKDKKFRKTISKYEKIAKANGTNGTVGAIVMHCNPFTLGHKYLIDIALQKTDFLYIFVVEEDHSVFSFEDRIRLLREQYKSEENICIMGSGKYMISKETFPEYFDKENLQNEEINPIMDLSIFGKYIAPALNIKIRFVGTEPKDKVTNQYNVAMKKILSDYGVDVCEIPRCTYNDEVISATKVRQLWKEQDYKSLEKYVPAVTLEYLKNKSH